MPPSCPSPPWPRRALLGTVIGTITAAATTMPPLRLGVLAFGTVQWVAAIIRRHHLDHAHGFVLKTEPLANNGAAKVALLGRSVDVIVSDWLFVAAGRARGFDLRFAPFSSATGALILGRNSTLGSLGDLVGRWLGVAGGPYDKSWMILRAAVLRQTGTDPERTADIVYAAPPPLSAKLRQGALDAVLTYWDDSSALEVAGFRSLMGRPNGVGFALDELFQTFDVPGILAYGFVFAALMLAVEGLLLRPWERRANAWRR